ncbi:MAG: hypothetical protein SGPRY_008118, partial [Prymnesium sp.]
MPERDSYLARCVVLDTATDNVASHLATYRLSSAQASIFWEIQWTELDMINSMADQPYVGGFLAQRYLENGTIYKHVPAPEHFVVESTLMGIKPWFNRLLLGVGFAHSPNEGFTWFDVVDRQLELIRYIDGLPISERASWRIWADHNFREHALKKAQLLFRNSLNTSRPADESISWFLPGDAVFFSNISSRFADAQPIAVARRAFPNYFPAEPVALPGTSSATSSSWIKPQSGRGAGLADISKHPRDKPDTP